MASLVCVWRRRRHAWQTAEQEPSWGKENNLQIRWEERERRKNLDFLQFEGTWPRNYKPENKKILLICLNAYFKVLPSQFTQHIYIKLRCFAFSSQQHLKCLLETKEHPLRNRFASVSGWAYSDYSFERLCFQDVLCFSLKRK